MANSVPNPTAPSELSFDTLVPRQLVHRAALAEVFLTDSVRLDDDRYVVAGQLPRMHSFFNDGWLPYHDLLLELEVARQAGVLIAHRHLGIPQGHAFIFHTVDIRVTDLDAHRMGPAPGRLVLGVRLLERQLGDGRLHGFRMEVEFELDGRPAATGVGSLLFLPKPAYEGLRRHVRGRKGLGEPGTPTPPPAAIEPSVVGRRDARNVVLGPAPGAGAPRTWELVVDQGHPCLFDHPLDHVPGMLMLEAIRQAGIAAASEAARPAAESMLVTRLAGQFTEFGELELATECSAEVERAGVGMSPAGYAIPVDVTLRQRGKAISSARVEVTPCP